MDEKIKYFIKNLKVCLFKNSQLENENMNFTDAVLTGLLSSGNLN